MTEAHELKCWPEWFEPSLTDKKPYEIRRMDRPFAVGDVVHLREFHPARQGFPAYYTGREMKRRITHILEGGVFGVEKGFCILSLGPVFWTQGVQED